MKTLAIACSYLLTIAASGEPEGKQPGPRSPLAPVPYEVETHRFISMVAAQKSENLRQFCESARLNGRLQTGLTPYVLIGQGAVEEDDCEWCVSGGGFGTRRFLRHFYDPLTHSGLAGWSSAVTWGLEDTDNDFRWNQLHAIAATAIKAADRATREEAARTLFLAVGHQVHLIQDMWQPSHTRNDPHMKQVGDGSALEAWGAENAAWGSYAAVRDAVFGASARRLPAAREYYVQSASLSNRHFFSDDTVFSYANPNRQNTMIEDMVVATMVNGELRLDSYPFVKGAVPPNFSPVLLARKRSSQWPKGPNGPTSPSDFTLNCPYDLVIRDQAPALLTMATSMSAGFIDYMFRGRLEVSTKVVNHDTVLEIKNGSDPATVESPDAVTFRGGTVSFFYETVNGRRLPLSGTYASLAAGVLAPGQVLSTEGDLLAIVSNLRDPARHPDASTRMGPERRIFAVYEGDIGGEPGFAVANCSVINMVPIKAGAFSMGSIAYMTLFPQLQWMWWYWVPEAPVHGVRITRPFWINRFEVTQAEFNEVMGSGVSLQGASVLPVVCNWNEAVTYCERLTAREMALGNLPAGYRYRLPTEAEWEYCCRAGTQTEYSFGNEPQCTEANICGPLQPVGRYQPNQWGVHDMHGNAGEWVLDGFGDVSGAEPSFLFSYPEGCVSDPISRSGTWRVIRGGVYEFGGSADPASCRAASRFWWLGEGWISWQYHAGIRVVLAPEV